VIGSGNRISGVVGETGESFQDTKVPSTRSPSAAGKPATHAVLQEICEDVRRTSTFLTLRFGYTLLF
jgi:hypothetical protein